MRWILGMLAIGLSVGFLRAADDAAAKPAPIDATDKAALAAAVGKDVTVTGKIKKAQWSKTGNVMNIDFENSDLLAAVFLKDRDPIDKAFNGDAARKWTGATVKVSGKLEKYGGRSKALEGRPQLVIRKPEQVTIEETKKE
jgi:hypothetical protein